MQVLAVTPLYPPSSRVGAWLSTHELLRALAARGHHVDVVSYLSPAGDYMLDGVHVRKRWNRLYETADVVISHLGDDQKAHTIAQSRGVPSVRLAHAAQRTKKDSLLGVRLLVCNSHATQESIGWNGPTIVVHPLTRPDLFRTTPGDQVTLVNLSPEKGVDLFALLAASLPHRSFLGVKGGYGHQRPVTAPNVEVIPTTQNMRDDVYARTRILLMPSEKESWGMVAVEAMCSGIPVIAHPTPGLVECLGAAGIFADRGDLSAWRTEVERLHDPDEWATASKRAVARVAELDPFADVERFCTAVESLAKVPA